MKAEEHISPKGELSIDIIGPDGNTKERIYINNLVVQSGRDYIAERLIRNDDGPMTHMAVGTSTDAVDLGDTALFQELTRQAFDSATRVNNITTFVTTYDPGVATGALTEAGIFNASSGGIMLCRTEFNVVNKAADDTMVITWTVTIS